MNTLILKIETDLDFAEFSELFERHVVPSFNLLKPWSWRFRRGDLIGHIKGDRFWIWPNGNTAGVDPPCIAGVFHQDGVIEYQLKSGKYSLVIGGLFVGAGIVLVVRSVISGAPPIQSILFGLLTLCCLAITSIMLLIDATYRSDLKTKFESVIRSGAK